MRILRWLWVAAGLMALYLAFMVLVILGLAARIH